MDHHGEPVDASERPLDPANILDQDRVKLDGLIVDNVRIITAVLYALNILWFSRSCIATLWLPS